jgi:hypothetical protein
MLRDHSTTEVVDPRDFIWHESARDLDPRKPGGAQHLTHRCWYSFEQLKGWSAWASSPNVDALKESRDFTGEYATARPSSSTSTARRISSRCWSTGGSRTARSTTPGSAGATCSSCRRRRTRSGISSTRSSSSPRCRSRSPARHLDHRVDRGLAGDPLGTPEPAPRQRGTHQQRDHADPLRRGRPRRLRALPWRAVGGGRHGRSGRAAGSRRIRSPRCRSAPRRSSRATSRTSRARPVRRRRRDGTQTIRRPRPARASS